VAASRTACYIFFGNRSTVRHIIVAKAAYKSPVLIVTNGQWQLYSRVILLMLKCDSV